MEIATAKGHHHKQLSAHPQLLETEWVAIKDLGLLDQEIAQSRGGHNGHSSTLQLSKPEIAQSKPENNGHQKLHSLSQLNIAFF